MLIDPDGLAWRRAIPDAGERSPEHPILSEDPDTGLNMLMLRAPVAVRMEPHTRAEAETHLFLAGGERFEARRGGVLRMPGGVVHEAWLPFGSLTLNVLESGWVVDWVAGGPSVEDVGVAPPPP